MLRSALGQRFFIALAERLRMGFQTAQAKLEIGVAVGRTKLADQ
jgi:hypothetical protein